MIFRVEIDALVLVKIQKHCRESPPGQSTGVLLGFDVVKEKDEETVLQVTNCCSTLAPGEDSNDQDEIMNYQDQMLTQMTNVKMDGNIVGWYSCAIGDSFMSDAALLESQCDYQKNIPQSVVIIYDPQAFALGKLPFRVLQVHEEFLNFRNEAVEARRPLDLSLWPSGKPFLVDVPFEVLNSVLVDAFVINYLLVDPNHPSTIESHFSDRRVEATSSFLSNQLMNLSNQLDCIDAEQRGISSIAKRAQASGGRDLKRHRDDLAFECATQTLESRVVAQQTKMLAAQLEEAAITSKQCLSRFS